jgi:hypothetical protein
MSAIKQLQTNLHEKMIINPDMSTENILDFIDEFITEQDDQYRKNKENKALSFGKWKGFTIKELSVSDKGKSYLEWLLSQQWCSEDKFGYIHEECRLLNIKKKIQRKAVLN